MVAGMGRMVAVGGGGGSGGVADGGRLVVNCGSLGGAAMAKFEI